MLAIIMIFALMIYFLIISWLTKGNESEQRTDKIVKPLSKIIELSPLIGGVIFTILSVYFILL